MRELKPGDKVVTAMVDAGSQRGLGTMSTTMATGAIVELQREFVAPGDLVLVMVPQGAGSRVELAIKEHFNVG